MAQERREKGEVRKQILNGIEEKGPMTFSEIKKYIFKTSGKPVADKVVWDNLSKLRQDNKIEKNESSRWQRTESYWKARASKKLAERIKKEQLTAFGQEQDVPCFSFGDSAGETGEFNPPAGLHSSKIHEAFQSRFTQAVVNLTSSFTTVMEEKEGEEKIVLGRDDKGKLMEFAARCLSLGHKIAIHGRIESGEVQEELDFEKQMEKISDAYKEKKEAFRKIAKIHFEKIETSPIEEILVNTIIKEEDWEGELNRFFLEGLNYTLSEKSIEGSGGRVFGTKLTSVPLPAYQARLLADAFVTLLLDEISSPATNIGYAIRDFAFPAAGAPFGDQLNVPEEENFQKKVLNFVDDIIPIIEEATERHFDMENGEGRLLESIPFDPEKNLEWLDENVDVFFKFLDIIKDMRFGIFAGVGYEEFENYPKEFMVPQEFDDWLTALKEGRLDHQWTPELKKALYKSLSNTIYRIEKGLEPKPTPLFIRKGITTRDIYRYYPGADSAEWWKDFKKQVEERLEKIPLDDHDAYMEYLKEQEIMP